MKLDLSEKIRRMRRERNMSQEELAEVFGVSSQTVSRWETGATYPDVELLPVIAGFFGCSTDELLGVSNALREERINKYWDEFENARDDDEQIAVLRRAYTEFPNEWLFGVDLCECLGADYEKNVDEVRRIVYDALGRCTDTGWRTNFIMRFASIETDDRIEDFLREYSETFAVTRAELLELRYRIRNKQQGDPLYAGTKMYNQIEKVKEVLTYTHGVTGSVCDSNVKACRYRANLDYLNTIIGVDEETRRKSPVLGDGTVDLWWRIRMDNAISLARVLSESGKYDDALNTIEEATELAKRLYALPVGTVLSYRLESTGLLDCKIEKEIEDGRLYVIARYLRFIGSRLHGITDEEIAYESYCDTFDVNAYVKKLMDTVFDPIRNHPRYKACVERMEAAVKQK